MYNHYNIAKNKLGNFLFILYVLGAIRINGIIANNKKLYYVKIRIFHPLSFIIFILLIIVDIPIVIYKMIIELCTEVKGNGLYIGQDYE